MARQQNDFSDEAFLAAGVALGHIGRGMTGAIFAGAILTGMSIRGPQVVGGEFLLVAKGTTEDGENIVGFHSAFTLGDAVRGLEARIRNGTLKWRVDEFRKD